MTKKSESAGTDEMSKGVSLVHHDLLSVADHERGSYSGRNGRVTQQQIDAVTDALIAKTLWLMEHAV